LQLRRSVYVDLCNLKSYITLDFEASFGQCLFTAYVKRLKFKRREKIFLLKKTCQVCRFQFWETFKTSYLKWQWPLKGLHWPWPEIPEPAFYFIRHQQSELNLLRQSTFKPEQSLLRLLLSLPREKGCKVSLKLL
jgi:hypothetical protein